MLPVRSFLYLEMKGMVAPSSSNSRVLATLCSANPNLSAINAEYVLLFMSLFYDVMNLDYFAIADAKLLLFLEQMQKTE
jgi:hypothetical protein